MEAAMTDQAYIGSETLPHERVIELMDYDPHTGVLMWRKRRRVVRCVTHGYLVVRLDGRLYRAHRVIWLIMTGKWPTRQIDHRDMDRANNRWENLREATNGQNQANRRAYANSRSGVKGVSWDKEKEKWRASIGVGGKVILIGRYDTIAEAKMAYDAAAIKYFGSFARAA
jgi:hypothetical protein